MNDEINLVDILKVILKYKKLIFVSALFFILSAFVLGIRTPKMYRSTVSILPLDSSTGSLSQALGFFGGSMGGSVTRLTALLNSRLLAAKVLEEPEILKAFYSKKWDKAKNNWVENFTPSIEADAGGIAGSISVNNSNKDGTLQITATWTDPGIAAKIANTYVDKLSDILNSRSLNVTFQLIDPAVPIRFPFKPRTKNNMIMGGLLGLFFGVFLAFIIEYIRNLPPIKWE